MEGERVDDEQGKAIRAIEAQLQRAIQAGQADTAWRLWELLLAQAPDHPEALMALGQHAFHRGDLARARGLLQHLVATDGRHKQQWIKLAVVCAAQHDEHGEALAISGVLTRDPHDLVGLILRADLLTRQGKLHAAARAQGAVAAVAPPLERLAPELRPAVERALAVRARYDAEFASHLGFALYGDQGRAALAPARQHLEAAIARHDHDAAHEFLGRIAHSEGDTAAARIHLSRALALNPQNVHAERELRLLNLRQEEAATARAASPPKSLLARVLRR